MSRIGLEERLARHRFGWVVEPLLEEPSLLVKPMFGCLACYVHGRLMLVLADRRPPWRGLLVPTSVERQAALRAVVPGLTVHRVLRKWLVLADGHVEFEAAAVRLARLAGADDPRLGVEPRPTRRPQVRRRISRS
ncbi:MAG: hypothetical protein U0807_09155 [Candidatus Binatia bacterium]